jgi:hypothetical protein
MRKLVIPLLAAFALTPASAEAAGFVAKLYASGHHPTANRNWPIRVTARTRSGRPLHAIACYHFLSQGTVVHTQCPTPRHPGRVTQKAFHFYGSFRDRLVWPPAAIKKPLTLQVAVKVQGRGTVRLNYWIRVRR